MAQISNCWPKLSSLLLSVSATFSIGVAAVHAQESGLLRDGSVVVIVVPYDAGGGYDTTTRALAPCIETSLRNSNLRVRVVVQNTPGAGGKIGTQRVYASEAGDFQILMNAVDIIVSQQVLEDAQWDTSKFQPLGQFLKVGRVIMTGPNAGPADMDVMDLVKQSQTKSVLLGNTGIDNQVRLLGLLLTDNGTPLKYDNVQFDGTASAITALLRGTLEAYVTTSDAAKRTATANPTLRILSTSLSDLPTKNKDEIAAAASDNIRGFFASPHMRASDVSAISNAIRGASADPVCTANVGKSGLNIAYTDPKSLKATLDLTAQTFAKYKDNLKAKR